LIPLKNFSDYFFESIAINAPHQIQITSVCNAKCIFCSNEQNPFDIKRSQFRSIEEIEKIIWASGEIRGPIAINESLPGRLSEGEAFLHPQFFEILNIIRRKYQNPIKITTNGSFLTNDLIKKLSNFNPIEIQISFPSITEKYWTETFNLDNLKFKNAKAAFSLLKYNNINVFASIVPMPAWVGWDNIEETIKFFSNENIKNILVYAPGYTNYTPQKVIEKLIYNKEELSSFLNKMSKKYNISFDWSLDPFDELYINYDAILFNMKQSYLSEINKINWLTSKAAFTRFKKIIESFSRKIPIENNVLQIENLTYGGNIECSGLWTIDDLRKQITTKNEHIMLPGNFLDKYGFDLQGENINDFFKENTNKFMIL